MSYNTYFGWELLTKLIENDLKNPGDTIVALVHWQLVQLGFSCLGSGDDKIIRDSDCGTEKLPDCWNNDCEHYSLRYSLANDLYILKCVIIDGSTALFNLYNPKKSTVSNVSFELKDVISVCAESKKKLVDLIPKIDVHILRIRQDLVMPVAGCYNCTNDTMPRKPDPEPFPRLPMEFNCIPNAACPWPPEMSFPMPNNGLLTPANRGASECNSQKCACQGAAGGGQQQNMGRECQPPAPPPPQGIMCNSLLSQNNRIDNNSCNRPGQSGPQKVPQYEMNNNNNSKRC